MPGFLESVGFAADPFESTNAEYEENLGAYFVPPPYFPTVLGDISQPRSHVIFAPRGGGKTAQRRMIENRSLEVGSFLCITYDHFDQPEGLRLNQVTWAYHMNQICRLILTGVLFRLDDEPERVNDLSYHQKQLLKYQTERFLGSLSVEEFQTATKALKNFADKVAAFWRRYAGPLYMIVNALLTQTGLDRIPATTGLSEETKRDETLRYHFEQLLYMALAVGFQSTYILVDRIDEMALTDSPEKTQRFISPLLVDLPTLETPGVGLKFFLWDQIEPDFRANGARPDRVPIYTLQWTVAELQEMLAQRLLAFSGGLVRSLNELTCDDVDIDLHHLVAHLAAGSPRDMIRVCKRIVAEETRTSEHADCLGAAAVWQGIRTFCDERAGELVGRYLDELRRVGRPTFTISSLASDVFRVGDQAARRKVQLWTNTGTVAKVGEIPNPPNRPLYLFGVLDLRLAIAILPGVDVQVVLGNFALLCPSCGTINFTDRGEAECSNCHSLIRLAEAQSLLESLATSS